MRPAPATFSMVRPTLPTSMVVSGPIRRPICIRCANQFGAAPWFSISNAFSDADLKTFIDNACTALAPNNIPVDLDRAEQRGMERRRSELQHQVRLGQSWRLGYGAEAGRNFSIMSTEATQSVSVAGEQDSLCHRQPGLQRRRGWCGNAGSVGRWLPDSEYQPVRSRRRVLLCRQRQQRDLESGSLAAQAAAYANAFFGYMPPYLGPQGTGCINNGGGGDWAFIGSNNTISVYETGPNGYHGPGNY